MPLCITLGYTESGRTAVPTVLYAGLDRDAARKALENPPLGITRTGIIANPIVNPTRSWPDNLTPSEVEPQPEPAPEEPPAVEPEPEPEPELPVASKKSK